MKFCNCLGEKLFLLFPKRIKWNKRVLATLKYLHPMDAEENLLKAYYGKKFGMAILLLFASLILFVLVFASSLFGGRIKDGIVERNGYGQEQTKIDAYVNSESWGKQDVSIEVSNQAYTEEEAAAIMQEIREWLPTVILADNESLKEVRSALFLPQKYGAYPFSITWTSSQYGLVNEKGHVENADITENTPVTLTAEITYQEISEKVSFDLIVCAPVYSGDESFRRKVEEMLLKEDQLQRESEQLLLPEKIDGEEVSFQEKRSGKAVLFLLLGGTSAVFVFVGMDRDLIKEADRRRELLLRGYPEFVSKLSVLTGAGLSVNGALRRIHSDLGKRVTPGPLYEELGIYIRSIDNGMLEERALQNFGNRAGSLAYRKFCTLLSQNMRKGSCSLGRMLEEEVLVAQAQQQNQIKRLGEEAGTKLLLPMIMMLAVVMILIMVPAFMSYQI